MRFRKTLAGVLFEDYGLAIWLFLLAMVGVTLTFGFVTLVVGLVEITFILGLELTPGLVATKVIGAALIGSSLVYTVFDFVRAVINETQKRIEDENMETLAALKGETYDPLWRRADEVRATARFEMKRGSGGSREWM